MRVDLHMHSTASDGAYSPTEVVQIALTNQMDIIALTDHDTVNGLAEAQHAAAGKLEVLTGVELTMDGGKYDILGYLFDLDNQSFLTTLVELRDARVSRADRIVQKLATLGVNVSLERVYALAGSGSVGRPHIARAMLEAGYVSSLQDAFDKYLEDSGPAYVPHYQITPAEAIQLIHSAGGIAVLAHPIRLGNDYRTMIESLVPAGLDGVEVYYPDHTPELVSALRQLAKQHDLVMTVGSDFHRREGDGSARIGTVKVPADVDIVAPLRERASRYHN